MNIKSVFYNIPCFAILKCTVTVIDSEKIEEVVKIIESIDKVDMVKYFINR